MTVDFGIPGLCPELNVLSPRKCTRQIQVESTAVDGDTSISVQPMTTMKTHDIGSTLQQIAEFTAVGCDIVHVACLMDKDISALKIIAQQFRILIIADIHFQPKYTFTTIEAGCGAVRANPGNIRKFDDRAADICRVASDRGVLPRTGVNAGSLDLWLLKKYGSAIPGALVESIVWGASLFRECGFRDFKTLIKHHDTITMAWAYQMLAERGDWPLHFSATEAGPALQGATKSAAAFGIFLAQGIGNTVYVFLPAPPVEKVKARSKLLEPMGLRPYKLEIAPCPPCGYTQVDVWALTESVEEGFEDVKASLRVAVMGCVVNGSGEAHEVDLGCASRNGKGQTFMHEQVVETAPEGQIAETSLKYTSEVIEETGEAVEGDRPVVQVFWVVDIFWFDRKRRPDMRPPGSSDAEAVLRFFESRPVDAVLAQVAVEDMGLSGHRGIGLSDVTNKFTGLAWDWGNVIPLGLDATGPDLLVEELLGKWRSVTSTASPNDQVMGLRERVEG